MEFAGLLKFVVNKPACLLTSLKQVQSGPLCTLEHGNGSFGSMFFKKKKLRTISASEAKRLELEESFDYEGYQVVRKELFAHFRDPAVTIRPDSVTFNNACITGIESVLGDVVDKVYTRDLFKRD